MDDQQDFDDAKAHTIAKHSILREYLKGWYPILAHGQRRRLLYFDGFAGWGELRGNYPGSPVVAIRTAAMAMPESANVHLEVRMVEAEFDRCSHLRKILSKERTELASLASRIVIHDPVCGECEKVVAQFLDEHENSRKPLGPAFFFLDQYGYSSVSMHLIRRILAHNMCETFSYLNWQQMHPYFTDSTKEASYTLALGGDEWKQVRHLTGGKRIQAFKELYMGALRDRAKAKYVFEFAMRDVNHELIYWLFFCTNSLKGLEVMKKAMWVVDPTGNFEYSDRDTSGQSMFYRYTDASLADDLDKHLRGRTLTSDELKEFVLTTTPEYRYAGAIKILKDKGMVDQKGGEKATYTFKPPRMETGNLW